MQTHRDRDFAEEWMGSLKLKAARMKAEGESQITAGKPGEAPIAEWKSRGIGVSEMPVDEHGILRISIGGGTTPVPLDYCVFRGDLGCCIDLLRKVLAVLEAKNDE